MGVEDLRNLLRIHCLPFTVVDHGLRERGRRSGCDREAEQGELVDHRWLRPEGCPSQRELLVFPQRFKAIAPCGKFTRAAKEKRTVGSVEKEEREKSVG